MIASSSGPPRRTLLAALLASATAFQTPLASQTPSAEPNRTAVMAAEGIARAGGPLADAFASARPAVVHVYVEVDGTETFTLQRPSTGVVVSPRGLVLTWWNLVEEGFEADDDNRTVGIQLENGERMAASLVATDETTGLTLLQADLPADRSLPAIRLRGKAAATGEPVGVLSFGDGEEHAAFDGVATPALGDVMFEGTDQKKRSVAKDDLLLTDAAIQERNHGAALVDVVGGLVGLCDARHVRTNASEPSLEELKAPNYGVVVPSTTIRKIFRNQLGAIPVAPEPPVRAGARAVARVENAIVCVRAGEAHTDIGTDDPFATRRRRGVGSGVVIDPSGLILTNLHLVSGASDEVTVILANGRKLPAEVLKKHAPSNTALLQADTRGTKLVAITVADGSPIPGDLAFALGNPEGTAVGVSAGIVSALRRTRIQVDATIGNHNAGGPIVDDLGRLIGLADGGARDRVDVAYERRGEEAKLDSGLYYTTGLDALRSAFPELSRVETEQRETPRDEGDNGLLREVVTRCAPSMLNIYIERVIVVGEEDLDNPFAEPETQSFPVSLGSGVIIDPSGLALTNWHVVDAATFPDGSPRDDHIVTATRYGGRKHDVRVLSISREEDLALVQLELNDGETLPAVELGKSGQLRVGDRAFAIGNPEGNANTITAGVVVALEQGIRVKGRWAKLEHLIETSAAINGGNSGGALLDAAGRLIGINSAGGSAFNVTGYAISVDHVRKRLNGVLLSQHKLRAPFLGIEVRDRDNGDVEVFALHVDSPAERAGVQQGDRVVSILGRPVRWSVDFALAAIDHDPAEPVELVVERDGREHTLQIQALSWSARCLERQLGVEVEVAKYRDAPDLFVDAARSLRRAITGDPNAEPVEIPRTLVRVGRVSPAGTQHFEAELDVEIPDEHPLSAGDYLLAAQFQRRVEGASGQQVVEFVDLELLRETMHEAGDYGGRYVDAWVFRDGQLQQVRLIATRLLP
jgi:S1-C subfamily serine protease